MKIPGLHLRKRFNCKVWPQKSPFHKDSACAAMGTSECSSSTPPHIRQPCVNVTALVPASLGSYSQRRGGYGNVSHLRILISASLVRYLSFLKRSSGESFNSKDSKYFRLHGQEKLELVRPQSVFQMIPHQLPLLLWFTKV